MRQASAAAFAIIKQFEGFRAKAYLCPAGVWTCGYGHTDGVGPHTTCTREQADAWLVDDVTWAEDAIHELVEQPLTQSQFDALVSFVFNIGRTQFARSTLLKKLNNGRYDEVPSELARWNKSKGRTLSGLIRRRSAEAELWNGGNDTFSEMPQAVEPDAEPKPLSESRTLVGAQLAAGGIGLTGIAEVLPKLLPVAGVFERLADGAPWVLLVIALAAIGFMVYARLDDRAKGRN